MTLIAALVVFIGFAYLMYANQKFREFGCGIIALVIIALAIFALLIAKASYDDKRRLKKELSAISDSDLRLTNMRLGEFGYSGWNLNGTVFNNSENDIQQLTLTVYLRLCTDSSRMESCVTTGQDDVTLYVKIPSGQAREIRGYPSFQNAPPIQSGWGWSYSIKEIRADLNKQ